MSSQAGDRRHGERAFFQSMSSRVFLVTFGTATGLPIDSRKPAKSSETIPGCVVSLGVCAAISVCLPSRMSLRADLPVLIVQRSGLSDLGKHTRHRMATHVRQGVRYRFYETILLEFGQRDSNSGSGKGPLESSFGGHDCFVTWRKLEHVELDVILHFRDQDAGVLRADMQRDRIPCPS